jgi:hypothetical protein
MRARGLRSWTVIAGLVIAAGTAAADPKPKSVDIKDIRDKLVVLQDPDGGIYVAVPESAGRVFYGASAKAKNLYEQVVFGGGSNGGTGAWDANVWAPRVSNSGPTSIGRGDDGKFVRWCGNDSKTELTELTGDKAKTIIDKWKFMSSAIIRRPHLLARDEAGVYYYVDAIRKEYGGKGFRVFIGKKGAMKQKPLTDIATDTAGDVFGTKTGDLRIVNNVDKGGTTVAWVKGGKREQLLSLDTDMNSLLIFKELGVYGFIGTICENN